MTNSVNFTKTILDNLRIQVTGKRTYYRDTQVRGLSFAVQPSGTKSFYVIKKIAGQSTKIYLGQYPDLSIENARKLAQKTLGEIALGKNPHTEKQRARAELTWGQLFEQYMTRYSKPHKKTWYADQQDIPRFCGIWNKKKLSDIKRSDVQRLHEAIFATNGRYMANSILKRVKAIFNKAIEWDWQGVNPAIGIKKYKETSRDRFIQPYELPHFIRAVNEEPEATIRDYFTMLLLTGVRKTNTKMMCFEQINWKRAEWRIPDTKNGDPLIVPLTDIAIELLQKRLAIVNSRWVFPRQQDNQKYIPEPKKEWQRIKERATAYLQEQDDYKTASLTDIRIHDIRRTFGSYQAISGASLPIIGKSLGHKCTQATQIYARLNLDPVRDSVVKATGMMFAL